MKKAETFDYTASLAELEEIARKVEDPETKLDELDRLVERSRTLIQGCRAYLRTVREQVDSLEEA